MSQLVALSAAAALTLWSAACNDDGTTRPTSPTLQQSSVSTSRARTHTRRVNDDEVELEIFAPGEGDLAGVGGVGWFVDLDAEFPGGLRSTGFTGNQLTGPGGHNNALPFPGVFAPGRDEKFQGLVVTFSSTKLGAKSCQNTANLFNITGPTNVASDGTEIWDTWIITSDAFGHNTPSTLYASIVADLNGDGIFNDAPDVVPDANHDGVCDDTDLTALGAASEVKVVNFFIR
jgi:hypothetical protein